LGKAADKDGVLDLRMALAGYLQTKHPTDTEKLTLVYLRFSMVPFPRLPAVYFVLMAGWGRRSASWQTC
jgi:hypothetical protein